MILVAIPRAKHNVSYDLAVCQIKYKTLYMNCLT